MRISIEEPFATVEIDGKTTEIPLDIFFDNSNEKDRLLFHLKTIGEWIRQEQK